MKKTSLLSLLTAGAIVATSAGTFAVWDNFDGGSTSNATITIKAGTDIKFASADLNFTKVDLNGTDTSTTAPLTVNTKNVPSTKKIQLLVNGDSSNLLNYTIYDGSDDTGTALVDGFDETVSDSNVYTVKASLKDSATSVAKDTPITVNVTAKLVDR